MDSTIYQIVFKTEDFQGEKDQNGAGVTLTFEEGCNKYLENCRQRNLRDGTINHYRQSYTNTYFLKTRESASCV